jgi:hypothetical protein
MSIALSNKDTLRDIVNVRRFGALVNGTTDDSTAVNAALTYVKANGGIAWIPAGTVRCRNLRLEGATATFSLAGAGKHATVLEHSDGDGTLLNDSGTGTIGYTVQGLTIDCRFAATAHAGARNGIAILDRSNVTIRDVHITDFKYSACLIYDDNDAGGVYGDNAVIDCSCDGLGVGANGFLFANMDRCSYLRVTAKGLVNNAFGAGVGVQFKNRCRWGSAVDCYAEDCYVGLGFAGDTAGAIPGPAYNTATNFRAYDCVVGCGLSNAASHNLVTNLYIDQASNAASLDAIDFADNAVGNSLVNVTVRNLLAAKRAAYFRAGCTDNNVHLALLDNINTTAIAARFEDTATYNRVRLSRMTDPRVRTGGIDSMVAFATAADNNSFDYDGYPYTEDFTIAAGVVVLNNAIEKQSLVIDTEAAAASDDLDTITNNFAQDGQVVVLRSGNDARNVVVKHNTGNILLVGAADFTLDTRRSYIELRWNVTNSKWMEVYKATHA